MSTGNRFIDSALSARNFSLAVKLAEKKAKETPNSSHALATRCFVLTNASLSGDSTVTSDDALIACQELAAKIPSDPKAISLLSLSFELLDAAPKEDLYEAAIRKYQTPGLAYEWFKNTLDNNDIIGMQKAAMSLSKGFKVDSENGRMVKMWAAVTMDIVIECCDKSGRLAGGKEKLLAMLGLKLVESVEQGVKTTLNAQEMFVKCQLLVKKGDDNACLEELSKFIAKERDLELLLMYFELLKKNEMWGTLYDACVKYLVDVGVDDWDTWKLAILSAKYLGKTEEIRDIIDNYSIGRNSQLAKIEIVKDYQLEERSAAIGNYMNRYMHKLCCYLDLKPFLDQEIIAPSKILELIEAQYKLNNLAAVIDTEKKATEKELILLVNYMKLRAKTSPQVYSSENFFNDCCQCYRATRHLQNKLADFDYFAGFEFIILAVQSYLTIHKEADTMTNLKLIIVLENALSRNKYEFHVQLWLAFLYMNTNMCAPLTRIFQDLKIKNIQFDTLSPYFLNHFASRTRSHEPLQSAVSFYTNNVTNELPAMVSSCFESSTFSKLKGFIEFKLRVDNSITQFQTVSEMIQKERLTSENLAIDTIEFDYIPILKRAYKLMTIENEDVDTMLHDNIDRKIMWDCGDHEKHSLVRSAISTPFNEIYDTESVKIAVLRELIIYDQHSRVWNDYRIRFIELVNSSRLSSFTEAEQWKLKTLAWLLDDSAESIPSLPPKPTDLLSAGFNNYYLNIQDFVKILTTLKKQSSAKSYFGHKEQQQKLEKLQKIVKSACREINRDDYISETKNAFKVQKPILQEWFKNDAFGKQFNIPEDIVNKYIKNFEQDTLKSIREI